MTVLVLRIPRAQKFSYSYLAHASHQPATDSLGTDFALGAIGWFIAELSG